jgi:glycosyltransferase involved in cell wall biosynthesis
MNVGLFDMYSRGHHLPYASRVKQALEAVTEHEVSFITLTETDLSKELFASEEITYLDSPEAKPLEEREEDFADIAETTIRELFSANRLQEYDTVHFLYSDTILGPLWRHRPPDSDIRIVGELNGTFFHRGTIIRRPYLHEAFLTVLGSRAGRVVDAVVPDRTSHEALWQDLYAYRCLRDQTFDTIIVHSVEASEYLSRIAPNRTCPIETVPYPAPENLGHQISQEDARHRLNIPKDDTVLLFFGSMRGEKGITFLLDALRQYRGPEFSMVLAGPPVTVDQQDITAAKQESYANVIYELGYIDTPELYYRAADAVILPYRRRYGKERPSQLFQEVCSAQRPVIVPDFGALGRLAKEWDLGVTFEQDSQKDLLRTIEAFATDGIDFSPSRMREYTDRHSYRQAATLLSASYVNKEHSGGEHRLHASDKNSR